MLKLVPRRDRVRALAPRLAAVSLIVLAGGIAATADDERDRDNVKFSPGNLVVSRSGYDNRAANVKVGAVMPPNCAKTSGSCAAATGATNNGLYPLVWNNNIYDGSFGITSKIWLDQVTPGGWLINSLEVPNSSTPGIHGNSDQMVTSFSSKSELALNLSTDGQYLTFMGYVAAIDMIDVSNSNTPADVDPTNPVGENFLRAVARVDAHGKFAFTETNAYSGNNGRAAILHSRYGGHAVFTAGNAGNGATPQPAGAILGAGTQIITPSEKPEVAQNPGQPTPVGSFNITQLGLPHDKIGKDDNFRGLTIFNNVLYYTKGSGGNGINTVYFLDTTGHACPTGVGRPGNFAVLPATGLSYNAATLVSDGLPSNMCILAGFPTTLANSTTSPVANPFGIWFADANTLYLADEGDGYNKHSDLFTHAAAQSAAGLQKWVLSHVTNTWNHVYTLQTGLYLGVPYTVAGYPSGNNAGTGLPWSPATDGLRNITGRVNWNGTATIWGITSTVSGSGDQGADPNKLVAVTDSIMNTSAAMAARESFVVVRAAGFGEVLRGVALTPGTETEFERHE